MTPWVLLGMFTALVFWTWRAIEVVNYKKKIVFKMLDLAVKEIGKPKSSSTNDARWHAYHKVSFERMVFQFWKPLHKFYEGQEFNVLPSKKGGK